MDTMTNKSETSSASKCKWCEKDFRNERTLIAHMCVRKRRWADKDMTHCRLGYRVFQMFYDMSVMNSKPKSLEDFIRSQYYEGFTKFGRACIFNEWLYPEKYAEHLIKNGVKLADWSKDKIYDKYLLEYVKRETGLRAMERTIMYLTDWATETGKPWQDYFKVVSTNRAVYDIRAGKISPWLLYLSETGDQLLTRFSDEQVKMIDEIRDPNFWLKIFKENTTEVAEVQDMCEAAGI